jgi:hypothetical protein
MIGSFRRVFVCDRHETIHVKKSPGYRHALAATESWAITVHHRDGALRGRVCERILRAPTPLVYTRHTSRFLLAWCLLLPLGLYTVVPPSLSLSFPHPITFNLSISG